MAWHLQIKYGNLSTLALDENTNSKLLKFENLNQREKKRKQAI